MGHCQIPTEAFRALVGMTIKGQIADSICLEFDFATDVGSDSFRRTFSSAWMATEERTQDRVTVFDEGKEAVVSLEHAQDTSLKIQIRWLIRRDMEEVLEIERGSFEFPWTDEDFLCSLRQRNCIGMVAEHDQKIVGFMIYELHKSKLRILNFAVAPDARRKHVGTQMVQRLIDKLSQQRRQEIILEVRETNLDAQLFFKRQGFRAVCVLRNHYDDTTEDAYYMQFRLGSEASVMEQFAPRNRIAEYDADAEAA